MESGPVDGRQTTTRDDEGGGSDAAAAAAPAGDGCLQEIRAIVDLNVGSVSNCMDSSIAKREAIRSKMAAASWRKKQAAAGLISFIVNKRCNSVQILE